jgi:hypothetical protein
MPCPREIPLGHRLISLSLSLNRFDVVRDRNPARALFIQMKERGRASLCHQVYRV